MHTAAVSPLFPPSLSFSPFFFVPFLAYFLFFWSRRSVWFSPLPSNGNELKNWIRGGCYVDAAPPFQPPSQWAPDAVLLTRTLLMSAHDALLPISVITRVFALASFVVLCCVASLDSSSEFRRTRRRFQFYLICPLSSATWLFVVGLSFLPSLSFFVFFCSIFRN